MLQRSPIPGFASFPSPAPPLLGGNAPFLVPEGADLDIAVPAALVAKMRNGGAACTAANRFYVHKSLIDEFTERFAGGVAQMTLGDGSVNGVALGPMIDEGAVAKVEQLVKTEVAAGAEVMTGGGRAPGPGYFFEPTVLRVNGDAEILGEEIFGPVAPIVEVSDNHDALGRANDCEHGLAAYVCGPPRPRTEWPRRSKPAWWR